MPVGRLPRSGLLATSSQWTSQEVDAQEARERVQPSKAGGEGADANGVGCWCEATSETISSVTIDRWSEDTILGASIRDELRPTADGMHEGVGCSRVISFRS